MCQQGESAPSIQKPVQSVKKFLYENIGSVERPIYEKTRSEVTMKKIRQYMKKTSIHHYRSNSNQH